MVTRLNRRTAAVLAGVAGSLIVPLAAATGQDNAPIIVQGPQGDVRGERVPYGDLNLASREGQKQLHARVDAAVRKVCGVKLTPDLVEHRAVRSCRAEAFESARPQVEQALSGYGPRVIIAASR